MSAGKRDIPPEPAGQAATSDGLYAYAISYADTVPPDGLTGVGQRPSQVRTIVSDRLAVIVSEVDVAELENLSEEELSEDGALAVLAKQHDAVVRQSFEHGPVLPLRFGTVLTDRVAAERLLARENARAITLLKRIDGCREWGVRLRDDNDGAATRFARATVTDHSSGTSYLASRRSQLAELDEQRRAQRESGARIEDALAAYATEVLPRSGGTGLLDVAFLVDRSAEAEFLARADRLAQDVAGHGLSLEVTGPWPPYSFSDTGSEMADA